MEEKQNKKPLKGIKKQAIYKMVPGISDFDVKSTIWDVMSEFRTKSIEEIRRKHIVWPKEVDEILRRLQFLD